MKRTKQFITSALILFLAQTVWTTNKAQNANLSPERLDQVTAEKVIDDFQAGLDQRWSYRHANGADFDAAIARLRKRNFEGISVDELGIELQKLLALGIDGHSRVLGFRLPTGGRLPFLIEGLGAHYVAFTPDRKAFLAKGFPYLTKIDGKAVADWCKTTSTMIVKGSPQYIRYRSLSSLGEIDFWRGQLNMPKKETVDVELTDPRGKRRKTISLPLADSKAPYGVWPKNGSRGLENNIGYLRLASMEAAPSTAEIKLWMPRFRATAGLIIDVRDNDGGERDALVWLYSYLSDPKAPPHVFTAAAYRLHKLNPENYLADHFMYRLNDPNWSPVAREAVTSFARAFRPRWTLPADEFSDWHYMALSRLDDPEIYYYDKPVVILMNEKCFSATDIFLAGLKGLKNVRLLGMPSSGGSAYTQEVPLGGVRLRLRIGTMASFQADGNLFDGHGIYPDIRVEAKPEYFIGGPDNVLGEAQKVIERTHSRR